MKPKFRTIRDEEGIVDGYQLGDYYLMKKYYWGNDYSWIINKDGRMVYGDYDFNEMVKSGDVEIVSSCKQGKQILLDRYMKGGK